MREVPLYLKASQVVDDSIHCRFNTQPFTGASMVNLRASNSNCYGVVEFVNRAMSGPDLLIFDYAPNLTIVGTYHALNDADKVAIKEIISESDFVALEFDEWRLARQEGNIIPHLTRRGYSRKEASFYTSFLDCVYLDLLFDRLKNTIATTNGNYNGELASQGLQERDVHQSEFVFCERVAREMGRDVHLVDQLYKMLSRLVALDPVMKARHLWYGTQRGMWPKPVRDIFRSMRDTDMLLGIEEKEGPIKELKRHGSLFVGRSHAVRYLNNLLNSESAKSP
ncbi:MAG: hypothetical protein HY512_00230 [Candidatus Aenigmarchaeota archaeon]|nr:hypothetical protein [Candidatus Aenigmarchaeota archaeon]